MPSNSGSIYLTRISFFPAVTYQAMMLQSLDIHQLHSISQPLNEHTADDENKQGRMWDRVFSIHRHNSLKHEAGEVGL